jgi:steroid delta-isomerase-like uncharacterized protein
MLSTDNKNIITTFIERVLNDRALEQADAIVAEDFIELDLLAWTGAGTRGLKDAIRLLTSFPDVHWVIDEMVAEDDKVCTRFTWTGTHEGPFFGIPATGRRIAIKGVVIDRLVAGRMADSRMLMDTLSLM